MADEKKQTNDECKRRKPYQKPEIIFEQELEVKAGSPVDIQNDPLDFN